MVHLLKKWWSLQSWTGLQPSGVCVCVCDLEASRKVASERSCESRPRESGHDVDTNDPSSEYHAVPSLYRGLLNSLLSRLSDDHPAIQPLVVAGGVPRGRVDLTCGTASWWVPLGASWWVAVMALRARCGSSLKPSQAWADCPSSMAWHGVHTTQPRAGSLWRSCKLWAQGIDGHTHAPAHSLFEVVGVQEQPREVQAGGH